MTDITDISSKKAKQKEVRDSVLTQMLTMTQVRNAFTGAASLMNLVETVKGGLQIRRIYRTLKPAADKYATAIRGLLDQFGAKDKDGNFIQLSPGKFKLEDEHADAYEDGYKVLSESKVEIRLNPIKEEQLGPIRTPGIGWSLDGLVEAGLLLEVDEPA